MVKNTQPSEDGRRHAARLAAMRAAGQAAKEAGDRAAAAVKAFGDAWRKAERPRGNGGWRF